MTYWVIPGLEPPALDALHWRTSGQSASPPSLGRKKMYGISLIISGHRTPHKLQGIWDTLRWFSSTFGLLEVDSLEQLQAKRKTIQESLVETFSKPQSKAKLPTKAVIIAARMGTLMKQEIFFHPWIPA